MMQFKTIAITGLALTLVCLAGCATYDRIPTGRWEGQGVYTEYMAQNLIDEVNDKKEIARSNEYTTSMTITEETVQGNEALVIEILSKHDELETLENSDRTHLRVVLQPYKTLPNGTQLLSMLDCQIVIKSEDTLSEPEWDSHLEGLGSATLEKRDGALIIHLDYQFASDDDTPFQDVIVLYGNKAYKLGSIRSSEFKDSSLDNLQRITWSESLRKVE
jgi:hypothetical protein